MLIERIVTVETRLQTDSELVNYLNMAVTEYEWVKRKIFYEMTHPLFKQRYKTEAVFEKHCRKTYSLHSRTINSIVNEVKGIMKAYMELKKTELADLNTKIKEQERKVKKTIKELNKLKPKVTKNLVTKKQLNKYRRNKFSLYHQKNKLNRLNIKYKNLDYLITHNIYKICFGTKKLLKKQYNLFDNKYKTHEKWHNDFIKNRDKNIWLTGSINEKDGNQMVALSYNEITDTFNISLRKIEKGDYSKYDKNKYIEYNNFTLKYNKQDIIDLINAQKFNLHDKRAIHFRFHRKNTKWYLQIVYTKSFYDVEYLTRSDNGVIGLDYNDGFIQLSETDAKGNLVGLKRYDLKYHGCGKRAKHEIEQVINKIVKYSVLVGKDISIEDLDFKKTKAKSLKSSNKGNTKLNNILHKFDYSRYKQKLKDISFNHKVNLNLVNPKNTSKIAKQKYCNIKKLNTHQGAAYVIARLHQGFIDKLEPIVA